ncbi:MAG: hypothetical protein KC643_14760, partial [Nitrospira sp.]|nr:hypothetical protein [Nitrospira sp.]
LARGDYHMTVKRSGAEVVFLLIIQRPAKSSLLPFDALFRSVSQLYGPAVLAVVLTGMGQDGMRGAEVIREHGGAVFA